MTKEEVSEPVEGDTLLGHCVGLSSHQRPIIHPVASAPIPHECGRAPLIEHTYTECLKTSG